MSINIKGVNKMNTEIIKHNGHIVISDIKNNQYFKQVYIGYPMVEAKRNFKQYLKGAK